MVFNCENYCKMWNLFWSFLDLQKNIVYNKEEKHVYGILCYSAQNNVKDANHKALFFHKRLSKHFRFVNAEIFIQKKPQSLVFQLLKTFKIVKKSLKLIVTQNFN